MPDITHSVEETNRPELLLDVCLDIAGVIILFIAADEHIGLVNRKGREILGRSEEEILGRNWFDTFLPERVREATRLVFHEMMAGRVEENEHSENVLLTSDGTERLIHWHNALVRDDDGQILGTLSSGLDVTDFRENEAALRESEARSRAILETAVEAIITADDEGRIESFNPAAERMFGYSSKEAVGQSLRILMPPPFKYEHDKYMRAYLETGEKKVIGVGREVMGVRRDGTTFPMELGLSEVNIAGKRLFTAVIRDISDRRELEKEVLRISEEERERIGRDLHDGLGSMLSGAAMGVQGLVKRARTGGHVQAEDLERVADMLEDGAHQAHVLARGLNPVRLETEGLTAALQELAGNVREVSDIACTVDADSDLPPIGATAATQLYRIAQEAVTNAVKHADASRIRLELGRCDQGLRLTVTDDGVGLPSVAQHDGLGMHIMPYRARLINAHFNIDEADGGGTRVSCLAPIDRLSSAE